MKITNYLRVPWNHMCSIAAHTHDTHAPFVQCVHTALSNQVNWKWKRKQESKKKIFFNSPSFCICWRFHIIKIAGFSKGAICCAFLELNCTVKYLMNLMNFTSIDLSDMVSLWVMMHYAHRLLVSPMRQSENVCTLPSQTEELRGLLQ